MVVVAQPSSVDEQTPSAKARRNGRWAEIMFRAMTRRERGRWKFVSFRGDRGAESRGIVDVVAIRRNTKAPTISGLKTGDLFDVILVQLKGGDARNPTTEDVERLRRVARHYRAMRVVLYSWKRGHWNEYRVLDSRGRWQVATAEEAFA